MTTLTAYSARINQEFAVTLQVTDGFGVKVTMNWLGEELPCRLTYVQGNKPCVELSGPAAQKIKPGEKKPVQLLLRTDWKVAQAAVEVEAKRLEKQADQEILAALREAGKLVYLLSCGGDSHERRLLVGYETDSAGYREGVRVFAQVGDSRPLKFHDVCEIKGETGDFALPGFYGEVELISETQYNEIAARADRRESAVALKIQSQNADYAAKFIAAKATNQAIFLYEITNFEPCYEEGCVDIYKYYAMPDGSKKEERVHTY